MKKILVPIDFSECSANALGVAAQIAKKSNAEIEILNVFEAPTTFGTGDLLNPTPHPIARFERTLERDVISKIENDIMKLIKEVGLENWDWEGKIITRKGNPEDVILEVSEKDTGLIVMGTKGISDEKIPLIGSTTCNTLRASNVPVLAVPLNFDYINQIKHIVYATDLKHNESEALGKLADIAYLYDADITFVHVANRDDSKDEINKKRHKLNQLMHSTPYDSKMKNFKFMYADTALEGLTTYNNVMNVGMIAMTTHTRSVLEMIFHKSLTRLMVLYSKIPVLAFNEENNTEYNNRLDAEMKPIVSNVF